MKICFIIEAWKPFYAGGQVHAWELCKRLAQDYNCSIDLYTRKLRVDKKDYTKIEKHFNGHLKIIRCGLTSKYNSIFGRISWVASVITKNIFRNYGIIHGQANLGGVPTRLIGLIKNTPTVFTVHGSGLLVWDELSKGLDSKLNYNIEKFIQTRIKYDVEISVDKKFCKFKNKNKPLVIANGVDIQKFDKIKIKKEKEFFKIIFVGRLHPQKGLKYLIDAINIIKTKLKKKVEFHIIGSGELQEQIKKQILDLKLEKLIKLRGKIFGDELIKEYKSSHLFVLPSIFEGQPLTLLEAWAANLPVLVTDVGDNSQFIQNGKNGWIIPKQNPSALAKHLKILINTDTKILDSIGKRGYDLVKREYSWDKMVRKTLNIYKKLKNE